MTPLYNLIGQVNILGGYMITWEDLINRTSVLQGSLNELLQTHKTLQSSRDAREWDNDSRALIDLMQSFKNDWNVYRKEQETLLEHLNKERDNKPLLSRLLSKRPDEIVKKSIEMIDAEINGIDVVVDELNEKMDKTPANKSEQEEISDVIKEVKKELTLQKREINENLRQTRASARQKTANWTGSNPGLLGTVARYQRSSIRMEKERALVPAENLKTFVEKKLVSLDRDLNWVKHFKSDAEEDENQLSQEAIILEQVERCKYCGRRIYDGVDVCTGCGATI